MQHVGKHLPEYDIGLWKPQILYYTKQTSQYKWLRGF